MKSKGVNRVVIGVKDLDKAVALYSKLLSTSFQDVSSGAEAFGLRAAISWEAGIELFSPLPGRRDTDYARFIEEHGEGLAAVVFAVDDVEEARVQAGELHLGVSNTIELDREQTRQLLGVSFARFKEYELKVSDTMGTRVLIGQIEPGTGVLQGIRK